LTKSIDRFELFEVQAREVGFTVEPTEVWTYGEGCECGCKWMVLSGMTIAAHCKTVRQVAKAIATERKTLQPLVEAHKQKLERSRRVVQLSLIK
jgi:hypothetical protein